MARALMQIGFVALGSALGGLARWGVSVAAARWLGSAFPYGTLLVNLMGSFFLGWFLTTLKDRWVGESLGWIRTDDLRLLLAVGFTGAYTTFSTFEWESHEMLKDGQGLLVAMYLSGSLFLGLLAVRAGVILARYL